MVVAIKRTAQSNQKSFVLASTVHHSTIMGRHNFMEKKFITKVQSINIVMNKLIKFTRLDSKDKSYARPCGSSELSFALLYLFLESKMRKKNLKSKTIFSSIFSSYFVKNYF